MSRFAALRAERHDRSEGADRPAAVAAEAVPELGNQATQALFAGGLRARLEVGGADDPEEREADALADQVQSGPVGAPCACGGPDCPSCGGGSKIRRKAEGGATSPAAAALGFGNRAGRPLALATRRHFEPRFGTDLGAVRVHDDPATHAVARGIGARAFAIGSDIGFAEARYRPETTAGRALLAHELAHVALGHGGTRRRIDFEHDFKVEKREREAKRRAEWEGAVERRWSTDLKGQSKTVGEEKERLGLAVLSQRVAAFDAAAGGEGWLVSALAEHGYAGPDLATLRQSWGTALIAAEGLALAKDGPDSDAMLAALETVPVFYDDLAQFSVALETVQKTRHAKAVEAAKVDYERKLADYRRREELEKMSYGPIGEPGERAFRASMALMRGSPPTMAAIPEPPAPISANVPPARERVYAADSAAQWGAVTTDVRAFGAGLSKLVVFTLPEKSEARQAVEYVEKLEADVTKLEQSNAKSWRIPATFYPLEQMQTRKKEDGTEIKSAKSIPWQFYLTNTGIAADGQPAPTKGQWVLHDLTSARGFKNKANTSDADLAKLQRGEQVDPPIGLFSELNATIRFPEGQLHFMLPSGTTYVLTTTEPMTLSDFLAGLGLVLAAVAIVAAVIATGGGATPAAVAFYAGVGAAAAGIGSTLADLHEKDVHGILTSADVDKAMVSIGLDVLSAMTMGLGRAVSAPGAAARFGTRFALLSRITQMARTANFAGDVYQVMSATAGFVEAFAALDRLPEDQRDKARAQLVRRALLTGALMTIAIKGDIDDIKAAPGFRMGADGAFVPHGKGETPGVEPHPHADTGSAPAKAAKPGEVSAPVHAASDRAGADLVIGPQAHAVGVGGKGRTRDFYFCSDLCGPILDKLKAVKAVMPRGHPELELVTGLIYEAQKARRDLKAGKLTDAQADAIAKQISDDIARLSKHTIHFGALMNASTADLIADSALIKNELKKALGIAEVHLGEQSAKQTPSRATKKSTALDEPGARSDVEIDRLGALGMGIVVRPSKGMQKIHFDAGNFAHRHGEALVPGMPKGMHAEVSVTLPDGTIGRADRVRFIYDADGDRIGAHVYEIKPNTSDWVTKGQVQAQGYADGLKAQIEADLKAKGKAVPTTAPDGSALYPTTVVTYDQQQMIAVMRAIRNKPGDAALMAQYEALARQVFAAAP